MSMEWNKGLSASSYEEVCSSMAGACTFVEPQTSSDHETPNEPDASFSSVADPEGV